LLLGEWAINNIILIRRYCAFIASLSSVIGGLLALFVTSFLTVVGALIACYFPVEYFGTILAFTAGTFIYIGAGDLLPQAHERVDWIVVVSVICGAAIVPLMERILGI
jgi:zinc transporter ZupT